MVPGQSPGGGHMGLSVPCFATPEMILETKASGNCFKISMSVSSYYSSICFYEIILLLVEKDKILKSGIVF